MIMIWNRKLIYQGIDIEKASRIRSFLSQNDIKYSYKTVNSRGSSMFGLGRGHTGSFGEKIEYNYHYYIYVHKNDYDKAIWIINKRD